MPKKINLRMLDIFCVSTPDGVGSAIRLAERYGEVDNRAFHTHTGLIVNETGRTIEALHRYAYNHLNEYSGQHIIIGRHRRMKRDMALSGIAKLQKYIGKRYPYSRLPLIGLFPRLSKYLYWGKPVCSELSLLGWHEAGVIGFWKGVTPAYVADMIRLWRSIEIIYDNIWEA